MRNEKLCTFKGTTGILVSISTYEIFKVSDVKVEN